ncbi:unnamed protein product [Aphanomyces euteiches]
MDTDHDGHDTHEPRGPSQTHSNERLTLSSMLPSSSDSHDPSQRDAPARNGSDNDLVDTEMDTHDAVLIETVQNNPNELISDHDMTAENDPSLTPLPQSLETPPLASNSPPIMTENSSKNSSGPPDATNNVSTSTQGETNANTASEKLSDAQTDATSRQTDENNSKIGPNAAKNDQNNSLTPVASLNTANTTDTNDPNGATSSENFLAHDTTPNPSPNAAQQLNNGSEIPQKIPMTLVTPKMTLSRETSSS